MVNTELLGSQASATLTTAMAMTVTRAASMAALALSRMCRTSCSRFWDTLEAAVSS